VQISVDYSRCESHAQCVFIAPDIFTLDDEGVNHYLEVVDDARRRAVQTAVETCPMQAISILE